MIPSRAAFVVMVPFVLGCSAPVNAQSLGEIAKREAERRGTAPQAGKVYTNGDLTPDFTVPFVPPVADPTAAPAAAPASESPTPQSEAAAGNQPPGGSQPLSQKGEDYWRDRANRIRNLLDKQRSQIEGLETRVNELRASEDPATAQERALSSRALEKARTDLGHFEDEWNNFEATAKAQRIPEAWIR